MRHRTQADAVRLYDVTIAHVARRCLTPSAPRASQHADTTYRVVRKTETRPREAAGALDHVPAIHVDAPNVDVAGQLARCTLPRDHDGSGFES